MRWAGHVACVGERRVAHTFWWESLRVRDYLKDLDSDGRIILKWIFKKWVVEAWTGLIWLRIGAGGGLL
jgi:hypothetical protein